MSTPKDRVTIDVDPDGEGWAIHVLFWRHGEVIDEDAARRVYVSPYEARAAAERLRTRKAARGHPASVVLSPEAQEATR